MPVDLHTHPIAHGSGNYQEAFLLEFLRKAQTVGISQLGFTDHDWYLEQIDFGIKKSLNEYDSKLQVLFGLEIDYFPTKEQEIKENISKHPFDYIIGSVHHIGDWGFDVPAEKDRYDQWDNEELYEAYFQIVLQAVNSGLFQIIGHLDLIKIYGYRSKRDILEWVEPVLRAIKAKDLTLEVNSAGRYKPVGEIYPEERIIARCFELNIPLTIGSDAHEAAHVGRYNKETQELLKRIGYRKVATYHKLRRLMLPL